MIKLVIADDHTIVRQGIRRMLEEQEDFDVVGEAAGGAEAIKLVADLKPDVLLLDIAMPGVDGFEVMKVLSKKKTKCKVLYLTMYADEHLATRLLRSGAAGYVVKDAAADELVEAVHAVQKGNRYISASMRDALAMRFVEGVASDPVELLTDREFQILRYLASGMTNREIAETLSLSIKTVDAHRLNILSKLDLRNNSELTTFAIRHSIVSS
jgi:DNA-binding NarL/FixJ family response regulator